VFRRFIEIQLMTISNERHAVDYNEEPIYHASAHTPHRRYRDEESTAAEINHHETAMHSISYDTPDYSKCTLVFEPRLQGFTSARVKKAMGPPRTSTGPGVAPTRSSVNWRLFDDATFRSTSSI